MVKKSMDDLLKRRMSAAQQASELEVGNEAYETMFQAKADAAAPRFCELPIKSLCPFRTADIGFRPYPPEKLRAFSQQLAEQGIYERIIVRPIPNSEQYEILAGHNRTEAWRLTGHSTIPAEVVEADDARAISIAVATNLLRAQLRADKEKAQKKNAKHIVRCCAKTIGTVSGMQIKQKQLLAILAKS